MSQQGWHFKSISFPSNYTFEKGAPTDYIYRLDYFIDRKETGTYLQMFGDAGWDYMGEMSGWQYFRIESIGGEAPEIYSDNESKSKKYQRLMLYLVIFLPIYFQLIFATNRSESSLMQALTMVMFAYMLLYSYAMVRLLHRIGQLKKKI